MNDLTLTYSTLFVSEEQTFDINTKIKNTVFKRYWWF